METSRQKLDILILEDNLNLSAKELLKRAQHAANEDAQIYGWQSIEVIYSGAKPEQKGEFLRYSFDVFGIPGESIETFSEQQPTSKSSTIQKAAAAPDAEV
ncbi:MAG: hypothetical protein SGJ18_07620 [Pseudomonadota bacterium]|nr:hypothetical protein [Pseudomonadota bacterium]